MPKLCAGIIEVRAPSLWWNGVVSIGPLVEAVVPEVTGILFDVDNLKAVRPIASRRGIPDDKSFLTESLLKDFGILYYNATWITPQEVKQVFSVETVKKGWSTVFHLMELLETQFGEGNVRLVCWFT